MCVMLYRRPFTTADGLGLPLISLGTGQTFGYVFFAFSFFGESVDGFFFIVQTCDLGINGVISFVFFFLWEERCSFAGCKDLNMDGIKYSYCFAMFMMRCKLTCMYVHDVYILTFLFEWGDCTWNWCPVTSG